MTSALAFDHYPISPIGWGKLKNDAAFQSGRDMRTAAADKLAG